MPVKIDVKELETKIQNVFPLPQILEKIMRAVNDPDANATTIENIFKYEPSLTLKLLTLANSAYFGVPGKITNIRIAITLLGLNLIKSLAIHASVNEFFRFGTNIPGFSGQELWKHSVGVAVCAKMLARDYKLGNCEDFFTLGILHDAGLIIEYQFFRASFIAIVSRMHERKKSLPEIERAEFGMDHAELAQHLFAKWNLPAFFSQALRYHHDPLQAPESFRTHAAGLFLADQLVRQINFGFGCPAEPITPAIFSLLGIPLGDLEKVKQEFLLQIDELALFLQ
jgi:HD-like signal output (HDOD) protein